MRVVSTNNHEMTFPIKTNGGNMRGVSINNGKLVLPGNPNLTDSCFGLTKHVSISNTFIDGIEVSTNHDTDQAVVINTKDGHPKTIAAYNKGIRQFSASISNVSDDGLVRNFYDESFGRWFEVVKNTGVTPSLKFDFIDGKVVVDKDGEIITHVIGDVYIDYYMKAHIPGTANIFRISNENTFFGVSKVISFTDGSDCHYFHVAAQNVTFTEAFLEWEQSIKDTTVIVIPITISVVSGKLVIKRCVDVFEYEIGNTYLDRRLKFINPHTKTMIFLRTINRDSRSDLAVIDVYNDGSTETYYVNQFLANHNSDDWHVPTTFDESFMEWYRAVKAFPVVA